MLKFFTPACLFLFLLGGSAVAAPAGTQVGAEELFHALNVTEVNIAAEGVLGASTYEKSIGGLVCRKVEGVSPDAIPSFYCFLSGNALQGSEIYAALNVEEKNVTPERILGSSQFEKRAGDFICKKSEGVYPGAIPEFLCGFIY